MFGVFGFIWCFVVKYFDVVSEIFLFYGVVWLGNGNYGFEMVCYMVCIKNGNGQISFLDGLSHCLGGVLFLVCWVDIKCLLFVFYCMWAVKVK